MEGYDAATYGERMAGAYDDYVGHKFDEEAEVAVLAELARGGRVLELGVGTGRVAIPLSRLGLEVHGIESSPAMVERLRAKPQGDQVAVMVGDFAAVDVAGPFSLCLAVFSTLFMLRSQDDQLRCFANVAQRLEPGGAFVVEAFVPKFGGGADQSIEVLRTEVHSVLLEASRVDPVEQRVDIQRIALSEDGVELFPSSVRYAYPSELDLMARLAGLRLRHRWAGWQRQEFTADSVWNVSVYERPG
jgi:SAM-dependent methyltransferase